MAPSTINRLCACVGAGLEQAALHDKRIQNRDAWEIGLAALPNAQAVRNVILPDDKVSEFVAAAYGLDEKLGLLTDTLAVTGSRPSQAVRLRVEDLHDHPLRPKLMMPKSAKGGDRNRADAIAWTRGAVVNYRPIDNCEATIVGSNRRAVISVNSRSSVSGVLRSPSG